MKQAIKIGLLGFGTVGAGVVGILDGNSYNISQKVGLPVEIKRILVRNLDKARAFATTAQLTTNAQEILNDPEIDIIVELLGGEQPAKDYIIQALKAGKHVVTANKDVVAKHGREIFAAAEESNVDFMFEASVGGGIPIIRPLKQCLAGNVISEVMGIVNGTTNYMLTKMTKEKLGYEQVLAEAQAKGYAEADPTADVGGWDAARKIAILASIAFSTRVTLEDVYVEGITGITQQDIEYAGELGYVIKLLAIARNGQQGVDVRVHPALIENTHPLASVNDVFNAIYIKGDAVGEAMFYGRGAGSLPTGSAVVADIIDVARDIQHNVSSRILCTCFESTPICSPQHTKSPYYIRLLVADQPGVLAAIAGAFGAQGVSMESVIQKRKIDDCAELVLITYAVSHESMRMALSTLTGLSAVSKISSVIRVIE